MRLMIIGATGRTGKDLLSLALQNNNEVVAYVRSPQKLNTTTNLTIIKGQLDDYHALAKALVGCDAVLVTLGNSVTNSSANLFSFAMPNIIKAMHLAKVERIINLSALGVGSTYKNTRFPYRLGAKTFLKGNFHDHYLGESLLKTSNLKWTTIHPGPLFNNERTPNPTVRFAKSNFKMPGAPRTNRMDVAQLMLNIVNNPTTFNQQLLICSKQDTNS